MVRPKFKSPWEEEKYYRINLWIVVILAFILVIYITIHNIHVKQMASHEKKLVLKEYENDYVQRQQIESRHKKCFEFSYQMGSRSEPEYFDRNRYRKCLEIGPEQWLKQRRKVKARQELEMKKIMNHF